MFKILTQLLMPKCEACGKLVWSEVLSGDGDVVYCDSCADTLTEKASKIPVCNCHSQQAGHAIWCKKLKESVKRNR